MGPMAPLSVRLLTDPPGVVDAPARPFPFVVIHVGPSVHITCDRGGHSHRGLAVHGDVDIVPAGVPSRWEMRDKDTALILAPSIELLRSVAEDSGIDASRVEFRNRFQIRDRQIEQIGWSLKNEMESGNPGGPLLVESLASTLTAHLFRCHSSAATSAAPHRGRMSGNRLRQVLGYIEDNVGRNITLPEIAEVAGMSVSHCKTVFRESVGLPIHQYVIQRRVERAKTLLLEEDLPISQIAIETGFAHQSHLAYHVRRLLGISPRKLRGKNWGG